MVLYRYRKPGWRSASIGVGTDHGLVDLTSRDGFRAVPTWAELLRLDQLAARVGEAMAGGHPARIDVAWNELADGPDPTRPHLLAPLDCQEVWAAGVTYEVSRYERMRESELAADAYARVYGAERPELFLKATPARVVPPGGTIRVRPDSRWTVPEPELAVVCRPDLTIVGYTIGNDVSARDIEGENPLYLPQAKIYRGACALGPGLRLADESFDPLAQTISCTVRRDGQAIWSETAEIARLKRSLAELVSFCGRELDFPEGLVLLTGTCLVPPESFCLRAGDIVEMELSGVGVLRNVVAG